MSEWSKLISDLEREIVARGMSINSFCRKANINDMTWRRIRHGQFAPRQDTLARINKAIEQVRREPASTPRVKRDIKGRKKKPAHRFEAALKA